MSEDIVDNETLLERAEAWARALRECMERYELSEEEATIYEATAKCFESATIMVSLSEGTKRQILENDVDELRQTILSDGRGILMKTTVGSGFRSAEELSEGVDEVIGRRVI